MKIYLAFIMQIVYTIKVTQSKYILAKLLLPNDILQSRIIEAQSKREDMNFNPNS